MTRGLLTRVKEEVIPKKKTENNIIHITLFITTFFSINMDWYQVRKKNAHLLIRTC